MGKGENGYEKYMADDPTGINHVLDELYGVVFNEASAVLSFDEQTSTSIVPMNWR